MDIDRLIRNWHIKASEEDYFSRFTFEYLAFVAFLRKRKFVGQANKKDRAIIQKLKQDTQIEERYLQQIQNKLELRKAWVSIKQHYDSDRFRDSEGDKWWNCSHDEMNQQRPEEREKPCGVIHDLRNWENMVELWYRVRNNLFHGEKEYDDERDRFAVEYGYRTLKELVELLLEKEEQ